MKTTSWLCPIFTLLCATKLVYTAQSGSYDGYPLESMDSQMLQNDYFLSKRDKPSLSIVNPLDVLRQRLLLEIARRQMKENTRKVELNRAILNNVGKRMASKYPSPITAALYDVHELQQQQQQQQQQQRQQQEEPMQYLQPYEYALMPITLIFDYLQQKQQQQQQKQQQQQIEQQQQQHHPHEHQRQPWLPYESSAIQFDNNYINDAIFSPTASDDDAETRGGSGEQDIIAFNGIVGNKGKYSTKHIKPSNNEHASVPGQNQNQKSIDNRNEERKRLTLINNRQMQHQKSNLNLEHNVNPAVSKSSANDYKNEMNENGDDYQIQRYLYHLHKNQNHLTRK